MNNSILIILLFRNWTYHRIIFTCLIGQVGCRFHLPEDAFHLPRAIGQTLMSNPAMILAFVASLITEFCLQFRKNNKIGIFCISAKHTALRRKSKDWLAWNRDNVSEWGNMSIHELLFQSASTIKIQLSVFSTWFSWKIAELALRNNHSLTQKITK
jgi:hypothetical protein